MEGYRAASTAANGGREEPPAEELARAFGRGEPAAVDSVRARVRRILAFRGYGIPRAERADLEQEVLAQLWQATRRRRFDPSAGFWGFVEVVTVRRSIDWLRARRPTDELSSSLPEERPGPLQAALGRERHELALRALGRLDKPCRDLVYMHTALRLPYREIARLTGRSEGALRVQLHRCIRRAQGLLEQLETPVTGA